MPLTYPTNGPARKKRPHVRQILLSAWIFSTLALGEIFAGEPAYGELVEKPAGGVQESSADDLRKNGPDWELTQLSWQREASPSK
jgi:hypothetical protein